MYLKFFQLNQICYINIILSPCKKIGLSANSVIMSSQMVSGAPQENLIEDMNEDERTSILSYLRVLNDHLNDCGINSVATLADGSAGKLSKLTIRHLMELASDMCDELDRRDIGSSSPLASKSELTSKRNNARIRMAEFTSEKLNNLILEVVQEIDRRKIATTHSSGSEENHKKKRVIACDESSLQSELIYKKSKPLSNDIKTQEKNSTSGDFASLSSTGLIKNQEKTSGDTKLFSSVGLSSKFGIESLDAIIEDLGALIENDNSEAFSELRQKYEVEIQNLKQKIDNYEKKLIPEKNSEISKLMTRIEETELMNVRLRKEISSLNEQILNREIVIQDQKLAYDLLKETVENIQTKLSNRAIEALEASKNSARIELVSSNVFSELSINHEQIVNILNALDECISNFNQKLFLKLLREIATFAKSFIIIFDRILHVSQSLNIEKLCGEGESLKSEYISALSALLVSGKDFSARPQYCIEFKSNVETFKSADTSLFNFKIKFESTLQNN